MSVIHVPVTPIGTATTSGNASGLLGQEIYIGGITYRLVKAANAIATAAGKVLVTAITAGVGPSYVVDTTTTAANGLVMGVVVQGQTGSDGSTGLLAGDLFWLQTKGVTKVNTAGSVAVSTGLTTSTTAGQAAAVSATYAATTDGAIFANVIESSASPQLVRLNNKW